MFTNNTPRRLLLLSFLALIMTSCGSSSPTSGQCKKPGDDVLIDKIYESIEADKGLAAQVKQFDIVNLPGQDAVKVMGWVNTQSDFDKVQQIILTFCVRPNVNQFYVGQLPPDSPLKRMAGGGCTDGFKQCGDICIPDGDACNIKP